MGLKSSGCCRSPFSRPGEIFVLVQYPVVLAGSASLALLIGLSDTYLFVFLCLLDREDWALGGLGLGDDELGSLCMASIAAVKPSGFSKNFANARCAICSLGSGV